MIDVEERHLEQVRAILRREAAECEVRAYGSRVTGKARRYSDLDLALLGPEKLDWRRLEAIRDAFSESDLPFIVDVLDWHAVPEHFRRNIEQQYEVIQEAISLG